MEVWKLQCHYCSDTVSTGSLNKNYYKLHLEAVHNIQVNSEALLQFTLGVQNQTGGGQENVGNTLSAVANIMSMKGISIEKSSENAYKSSAPQTPGPLLNIKGITVQRVDEGRGGQSPNIQPSPKTPVKQSPSIKVQESPNNQANLLAQQRSQFNAAQARQQEQAINRWANGCEHGCRMCKKTGKNFTSFTKQGLLKHIQTEHEISERDYKEEFKCINLITRASNTSCKECGARIKRIPTSLNMHLKKHTMNIRSYWLKHLKPPSMPVMNGGRGRGRGVMGVPARGRGSRGRGNMGGSGRPGPHKCTMAGCTRSFDNVTALNHHRSWHGRGGGRSRGRPPHHGTSKLIIGEVRGDVKIEAEEEMTMEMDPMDLLEVGIEEDERGEEVEVDLDNLEVVDDDGAPQLGDELDITEDTIEITPCDDEGVDPLNGNQQENSNGDDVVVSPGGASAEEDIRDATDAEAGTKSE